MSLVIGALAAGSSKGVSEAAATGVKDAYASLKAALSLRFAGRQSAEVALAEHEKDPHAGRKLLEKELRETGAIADVGVLTSAQHLLTLLRAGGGRTGKYVVDLNDSPGVVIGDHSNTEQTYYLGPSR